MVTPNMIGNMVINVVIVLWQFVIYVQAVEHAYVHVMAHNATFYLWRKFGMNEHLIDNDGYDLDIPVLDGEYQGFEIIENALIDGEEHHLD